MTAKAALHQAILALLKPHDGDEAAAAGALTDLAVAFADVLCGEPVDASIELSADDTPQLVLAELRKQTTLLEVIAKQGDRQLDCITDARPFRVTGGDDTHGLPG